MYAYLHICSIYAYYCQEPPATTSHINVRMVGVLHAQFVIDERADTLTLLGHIYTHTHTHSTHNSALIRRNTRKISDSSSDAVSPIDGIKSILCEIVMMWNYSHKHSHIAIVYARGPQRTENSSSRCSLVFIRTTAFFRCGCCCCAVLLLLPRMNCVRARWRIT